MWTKKKKKRNSLRKEILFLFFADAVISFAAYFFLRSWAGSLTVLYLEKQQIILDELQEIMLDWLIFNGSVLGAFLVFVIFFLAAAGNKLAYIRELTEGIHGLRTQKMNHEIPLKGNNELTELAESINYLAETERQLKAVERNLSHDIRTPLTAILSYTEYLQGRENVTREELDEFLELTKMKADQIKLLTDRLLDGGSQLVEVEDGRLLMVQLVTEWEESLEDKFMCETDLTGCPSFSGQFDIGELRRIFDNLASNVEKYAAEKDPVRLSITTEQGRIAIKQWNKISREERKVESRKIGLSSIENIAKHYGGSAEAEGTNGEFSIKIILFDIEKGGTANDLF